MTDYFKGIYDKEWQYNLKDPEVATFTTAFDEAFSELMDDEWRRAGHKSYVNDPDDPGGETKFGITKRSYPLLNIRDLTIDKAKEIYCRDWWVKNNYNHIVNNQLAEKLFNISVTTGSVQAVKWLQEVTNDITPSSKLKCDGVLGDKTAGAINAKPTLLLYPYFLIRVAQGYLSFKRNDKYIEGWLNRLFRDSRFDGSIGN